MSYDQRFQPNGAMPGAPFPTQAQRSGQDQGGAPPHSYGQYAYPPSGAGGAPYGQAAYQGYWGYGAYPGPSYRTQAQTPFFNFGNDRFLKGMLMGAAAAYLLTNESVQRSTIKGAVRVWSALQGGLAEIKERFHDAEAELGAAESKAHE
ncbi:hypothetical protein Thimo_2898 [Thioflavicoccus mobilis 8321]|uniref:YtxH-like protein n=1 Tax=Thioflavicoccus mobilis 8321 TaxID=765912 RepID=L0H1S5_9GAMM|nr:hypothetical protein [Thioflavicoccus mobilis]AGA91595.1 hypothetical protein Thimo_2898 [Thioflavicoccus mobilis 8321]